MPEIRIKLFDVQSAFHASTADMRGFVGGRGSGKTYAGAADMFIRASQEPDLYGIYAPTFSDLSRFTLRTFRKVAGAGVARYVATPIPTLHLTSGAEILCGSLDNPEAGRGPSFRGVWIDEGSLICHDAFINVLGSLRSDGKMGWLSTTFTPRGLKHFTADIFKDPGPGVECFHATTRDNPFAPPEFYDVIRKQVTSAYAQQELEGLFLNQSAGLMKREWFGAPVDACPKEAPLMRCWDLASTIATEGTDPDWTAGALVGLHQGVWYICDVRHERLSPMGVENLIRKTAVMDGRQVPIRIEREPGSGGNITIDHYARNVLVGFDFAGVPAVKSKLTRAMPFAAAAEQGNVKLVRGAWNKDFLDEAESFGDTAQHDDQCVPCDTMISTPSGSVRIDRLFAGDMVITRFGVDEIEWVGQTGTTKRFISISDGVHLLSATEKHPVFSNGMYTSIDSIKLHDIILVNNGGQSCEQNMLNIEGNCIPDTQNQKAGHIESIFSVMESGNIHQHSCIERFGKMLTVQFQKVIQSITKTAIRSIIQSTILMYVFRQHIANSIRYWLQKRCSTIFPIFAISQTNGTAVLPESNGIDNMEESVLRKENKPRERARYAVKSDIQNIKSSIAQPNARGKDMSLPSEKEHVNGAMLNMSPEIIITRIVRVDAQCFTTGIPVWNIRTKKHHEYFANGVLVHNCDAVSMAINEISKANLDMSSVFGSLPTVPAISRIDERVADLLRSMSPEERLKAEAIINA